ncbi:outer membrane beta-barrel protein [Oecophyllibacter saccharovorans]|uniref:outer membrane beta-barrel protein n=1 Tax=Oecophyllibacter saccharovorans TaxID=2558360 RepID=UPI001E44E08A|nr:outer membrane beta-barrel protein [Oecophyllibacter saccharovorans]
MQKACQLLRGAGVLGSLPVLLEPAQAFADPPASPGAVAAKPVAPASMAAGKNVSGPSQSGPAGGPVVHAFTQAPKPKTWFSDIDVGLQVEAGIMANSARTHNGQNFGQLLSPYANEPMLNQIALTITKPVDPIGDGYGLGFNFQLIYGSDARIYEIAGISDRWMGTEYELTPTEANVALHMPWLTKGGLDGQIGILMAPMGVEVLNPAQRAFYTLAYTSEYSVPFEHVGAYFQWHVGAWQVLFGIDAGNQVSFGKGNNNGRPDGYFGFSGQPSDTVTVNGLFRVGPEDAWRTLGPAVAHSAQRFWYDLNASWQITPRWSVTGELNHVYDEGIKDNTWSAVGWGSYAATPTLSFNARAEVYRDQTGGFVTQFPGNTSYMRSILGRPARTLSAPPTTYGDLSFNAVWRPHVSRYVKLLQIRPEIRFDRALNNTRPFAAFTHRDRILIGGDVTLGF